MHAEIAQFFLSITLPLLVLASLVLIWPQKMGLVALNRKCLLLSSLSLLCAMALLIYSFIIQDLSVDLVSQFSHSTLPTIYKIAASWGNHEGSFLLFSLILSIVVSYVSFSKNLSNSIYGAIVNGVGALILLGFVFISLILANPFLRVSPYPDQGAGINPILQDPILIIHPTIVYFGYAGLIIVFSYSIALLLRPRAINIWVKLVKPWILWAWTFLITGIGLGSLWAYRELGWGGFWFWDPVENSSLMPWLIATALVHTIILVEKRRIMYGWTVFLGISGFLYCLIAFFIVRSGILVSVHGFAENSDRGIVLIAYFAIVLIVSTGIFAKKASKLSTPINFHPFSRETLLIIASMLFFVISLVILLGTLYPLLSSTFFDTEVNVGAPWFNIIVAPMFLIIAVATFISPLISWTKGKWMISRKRTVFSLGIGTVFGIIGFFSFHEQSIMAIAIWIGLGLSLALIIIESTRTIKDFKSLKNYSKKDYFSLIINMLSAKTIAHTAIAILVPAVLAASFFAKEIQLSVPINRDLSNKLTSDYQKKDFVKLDYNDIFSKYSIYISSLQALKKENYLSVILPIELRSNENDVQLFIPERRRYVPQGIETSEVGKNSYLSHDIQISMDKTPFQALGEKPTKSVSLRILKKPAVIWIWISITLLMIAGLRVLFRLYIKNQKQV